MSYPLFESDEALGAAFKAYWKEFNEALDVSAAKEQAYYDRLSTVLESSDQTVVWIQGQLFVENELTNMLRNVAAHNRRNRVGGESGWKPSFNDKVTLLHFLGLLSDEDRTVLKKVSKVRNDMVHINIEDHIPRVTDANVNEPWNSMSSSYRSSFGLTYDHTRAAVENLREIFLSLVVYFRVIVDVTGYELGLADRVRYNTTGETVTQRLEKQAEADKHDTDDVRAVK